MANPTLQIGASGDSVTEAQAYLINYGYLPSNTLSGTFGPAMQQAVRDFQSHNGLGVDGIIGPNTWALLQSNSPAVVKADGMPNLLGGSNYTPRVAVAKTPTSAGPSTRVDFTDDEALIITADVPKSAGGWWASLPPMGKAAVGAFGLGVLVLVLGDRK